MKKIVISSGNEGKIKEIKKILSGLNIEVLSKADLSIKLDVLEDGDTLEENSRKKAKALKNKLDCLVLADDSGLFVDYLDGNPGVHSSRYAGDNASDLDNNLKLLKELENVEKKNRTAYFKTVICLIDEDNKVYELEGVCKGVIAKDFMGKGGFGYDPLFIPDGYDKSFGQLSIEVKNEISHRSKALDKLRDLLEKII